MRAGSTLIKMTAVTIVGTSLLSGLFALYQGPKLESGIKIAYQPSLGRERTVSSAFRGSTDFLQIPYYRFAYRLAKPSDDPVPSESDGVIGHGALQLTNISSTYFQ